MNHVITTELNDALEALQCVYKELQPNRPKRTKSELLVKAIRRGLERYATDKDYYPQPSVSRLGPVVRTPDLTDQEKGLVRGIASYMLCDRKEIYNALALEGAGLLRGEIKLLSALKEV